MIEEPGSLAGNASSPSPQRGPEPSQRTSLAIFINETAKVLSAPEAATIASCAASWANLFSALQKVNPVIFAISSATI